MWPSGNAYRRRMRDQEPTIRRRELGEGLRVTVSAGVAHCVGWPTEVERLVGEADTLLYTAKQAGRNAVAFRDLRSGLVRLAGAAAGRRGIRQPPRPG